MPPRILLGDDAIGFRLAVKIALEQHGAEHVLLCDRWCEVPGMARAEQPDAILVDLLMPEIDLDALRRTREAAPEAVLAVISSFSREEIAERVADIEGIDLIFSKRERPDDIARALIDPVRAGEG